MLVDLAIAFILAALAGIEAFLYRELDRAQKYADYQCDEIAEQKGKLTALKKRLDDATNEIKYLIAIMREEKEYSEDEKKRVNKLWLEVLAIKDAYGINENENNLPSALPPVDEQNLETGTGTNVSVERIQ